MDIIENKIALSYECDFDKIAGVDFPFGECEGVLSPPDVPTLVDGGDRPRRPPEVIPGASPSQPALMPLVGDRRSIDGAIAPPASSLEHTRTRTHANAWKNTETVVLVQPDLLLF